MIQECFKDLVVSGWVAVHGPSVRALFPGQEPGLQETCVAELNNHFVFVASDKELLPTSPSSLIAEAAVRDADTVCSRLAQRCLVFMTKSATKEPKRSFVVRIEDWQRVDRLRQSLGTKSERVQVPEAIPALVIDISAGLKFWTVVVDIKYLIDWRTELFNVSERLSSNWSIRAGQTPGSELELHNRSKDVVKQAKHDPFPIMGRERGLFLICHFFKYWEKENLKWEQRAADIARTVSSEKPWTKQRIQAEAVEAGCIRPSLSAAKRRYASLFDDARTVREFKRPWVLKKKLPDFGWLLAVLFPDNFAAQLVKGEAVSDLTRPSKTG